jgi:ElaB/YqjD/DUF883 family membrane-anchored ribosome-binding protein
VTVMINRLPKQFQVSSTNGVRTAESVTEDRPRTIMERAGRCIGHYPVAALGAAFVVGLVLGRIVKR